MLSLRDLADLSEQFRSLDSLPVAEFTLGSHRFTNQSPHQLMGVINLSPDSWYRESVCLTAEAAIRRGRTLHEQGATIIDLGAESTLAQAARVDAVGQQSLLTPVIRGLSQSDILVSTETYHPTVARACLEAGARILNLTGTEQTEEIFRMVADQDAGVIICYVQGPHVRAVGDFDLQADPLPMLEDYFSRKINEAVHCGVRRIWIDPGLGFYYRNLQDSTVRIRHQMRVFLNTFRLRRLGWPICHALPHAFACFEEEVRSAEPFFAVLALLGQTSLLRTHEVAKVRGVLKTMEIF
jgi:dihydropteroate synthase